jgi:very-short-patch-repair endonuclease
MNATASGASSGSSPSPLGGGGVGERGRSTAERSSALRKAKQMRSEPAETEHRLWQILRAKRFGDWKFRRQARIGRYTPDFVCHRAKLIVEVDGGHHSPEKDRARDEWLGSHGFRILRFWDNDIFTNEEGVLTVIASALEASAAASSHDGRTPLPNPSPTRGEGQEEKRLG